jgi:F-type H+-transporting ATPase subunit b
MEAVIPQLAVIWPTLLAFIVLFVVLWRFAFPPLTNMLQKRADTIRESLEKAEHTRIEAERLLDEYKQQMADARAEAGKVIEQGRLVAEKMKVDIVAKAHEESAAIVAKARDAVEAEKKAAIADLQLQVADLSVAVAGKIIGSSLSREDHEKLIERSIADVGGLHG